MFKLGYGHLDDPVRFSCIGTRAFFVSPLSVTLVEPLEGLLAQDSRRPGLCPRLPKLGYSRHAWKKRTMGYTAAMKIA